MVDEGNAIFRRLQVPYCFSRNYSPLEDLDDVESSIYVHDRSRRLVMQWSIDVMQKKLEVLRDLVEDSVTGFQSDVLFEKGQVWRVEEENSIITPLIKEKLEKLQMRHDNSLALLDDSRNMSFDFSRRSSLLHRTPSVNFNFITADACKDLISSFSYPEENYDNLTQAVYRTCSNLNQVLSHPDRTSSFAVSITGYAHSLMHLLPGFVQQMTSKEEIKLDWLETTKHLVTKVINQFNKT